MFGERGTARRQGATTHTQTPRSGILPATDLSRHSTAEPSSAGAVDKLWTDLPIVRFEVIARDELSPKCIGPTATASNGLLSNLVRTIVQSVQRELSDTNRNYAFGRLSG